MCQTATEKRVHDEAEVRTCGVCVCVVCVCGLESRVQKLDRLAWLCDLLWLGSGAG
jgi:hypothetical protein